MSLAGQTVLITGATGGIGGAIARQLATRQVALLLTGRKLADLDALADELRGAGAPVRVFASDLAVSGAPERLAETLLEDGGAVDVVIHCAGVQDFGLFATLPSKDIGRLLDLNVRAPMALTRALLPPMLAKASGRIVNVGSIFGSIGFPCFATYSATKFAMRGFSEALRRELAGTGVAVTYVAPRLTRTAMNGQAASRMAAALGMRQDEPAWVAARVIREIDRAGKDRYLGWPEKFFVRLNAVFPRLVDGALIKQSRQMTPFTQDVA